MHDCPLPSWPPVRLAEIRKRAAADRIGRVYVDLPTSRATVRVGPALESGAIDAIAAGMSPTAERAQQIDFSDTYYESNLVVIIRK